MIVKINYSYMIRLVLDCDSNHLSRISKWIVYVTFFTDCTKFTKNVIYIKGTRHCLPFFQTLNLLSNVGWLW